METGEKQGKSLRKKRLWSHLRESSIDADPATEKKAPSRRTRLKKRGLPSIDEDSAGVFAADITGFGDGTQFSTPDGVATLGQIGGSSSNGDVQRAGVQVSTSDGGAGSGQIGVSSNSVGVVRASSSLDGVKKNKPDGGATSGKIGGSSSNGVVQPGAVQVSTSHGGAGSGQIRVSSNSVGVVRASALLDGVEKKTLDGVATSGQIGGSSSNGGVQRAGVQISASDGGAKSGQIRNSSNSVGVVQASASLVVQQSSIADGRRNSEKNDGDPNKILGQIAVVASDKNKSAGVHGGKMASDAAVAAGVQSDSLRKVQNPSSGGGPPHICTQADGKGLSQSGSVVLAPSVGTGPSGGGAKRRKKEGRLAQTMASNDGNKAKAPVQTNTPSSCPFFSQPIFDPMEVDSPPARVVRRTGLKRKSVVERSSGGYDRVAVREVKRAKRNPRPSETRLSAPMWHFVQVLTGVYAGEDPYKVFLHGQLSAYWRDSVERGASCRSSDSKRSASATSTCSMKLFRNRDMTRGMG